MSIRIGNGTLSATATNRERIVLNTMTQSNMIVLQADAAVPSINVVFNDTMSIGRKNDSFIVNAFDSNLMELSIGCNVLCQPTYITSTLNTAKDAVFASSVYVSNAVQTSTATVNDFTINVPDQSTTYMRINKGNQQFLSATSDNKLLFTGRLGISVNNPTQSLHVGCNAQVDGYLQASNLRSGSINDTGTTNKLYLNETVRASDGRIVSCAKFVNTNLHVNGELVADRFNISDASLVNLGVSCNVNLANISCSNVAAIQRSTLSVNHKTAYSACNIIEVKTNDIPSMTLDPLGRLLLGDNSNARGMFDIKYTASNNTSNLLTLSGIDTCDTLFIDNNANLGIGTTIPLHHFHVERCDDHATNNAFIGLYDKTIPDFACNVNIGPFLIASNVTNQVCYLDKWGGLTLGATSYDSNWTLSVASNIRSPLISTSVITSSTSNIDFSGASFCNVQDVYNQNITVSNFASTSNLTTNYLFSSNFSILGLDIFENSNASYFKLKGQRWISTGSSACFSESELDLQYDPIREGKVKVVTQNSTDTSVSSIGINVTGGSRNSVRVTSSAPTLELSRIGGQPSDAYIGLDQNMLFMAYGNVSGASTPASIYNFNRLVQLSANGVRLCRGVQVTSDGRMSVNLSGGSDTNPTFFSQKLIVRGATQINDLSDNPVLTVTETAPARVGINTASPSTTLHANGSVSVTNGNLGVGTTVAGAAFHVATGNALMSSNLTVLGDIIYRGNTLNSSVWTSSGSNAILTTGNVGVGTSTPEALLHVRGRTILSSTSNARIFVDGGIGIGTSAPRQAIDVVNSNVCVSGTQGRIGIGTVNPLFPLHVEAISYFACNVGIGTNQANFMLDVGGDINFRGQLYQNNSRYVSSQWTTNASSNVFITNNNVGVGTSAPLHRLHVDGGIGFFSSNVVVQGTLSAARSVATTSDARVKTNLQKIIDPLKVINNINGYKYTRTDIGCSECGLIAQEVQKVLPEVIGVSPDTGLLNVSYGNMAAVFVEAIKTLQARIETLENIIDITSRGALP